MLYPLNQLKDVYPALFAELRKNYASREDIASLRIPPLDYCLWNDVLHLSPVSPFLLKAALGEAGHDLPERWRRFFRIDARLLNGPDAVVYRLLQAFWSGRFDIAEASEQIGRECVPFDSRRLPEFAEVPEAARDYYASVPPGAPVLLFLYVPHVLYRGRIDLKQGGIDVIEV